MKTLIEIAKERGAKIMEIFDVDNPKNTTGLLVNEKILQFTYDDYCKQFEPVKALKGLRGLCSFTLINKTGHETVKK